MGRIGQWRHWIKLMINRTLTFSGWRVQKGDITPNMIYICYISSWIFQFRSLLESGGHPRKISNFCTYNISHLNTWRQNAKAVGNIITVGQCFFSSLKKTAFSLAIYKFEIHTKLDQTNYISKLFGPPPAPRPEKEVTKVTTLKQIAHIELWRYFGFLKKLKLDS